MQCISKLSGFFEGSGKNNGGKSDNSDKRTLGMTDKHMCPDCRGAMAEVDRVNENGFSFIWYECMQANCNGQWLEKKAGQMEVV